MQVNPDEMKKNTNSQKTSDNEDGTAQAEPTSVPVEDVETGEAPSDAQTQTEEENLTPTPELTPAALMRRQQLLSSRKVQQMPCLHRIQRYILQIIM